MIILFELGFPMFLMFMAGIAFEQGAYVWMIFFIAFVLLFIGNTVIAVLEYNKRHGGW